MVLFFNFLITLLTRISRRFPIPYSSVSPLFSDFIFVAAMAISFPDLLWTKLKARSVKVRKFVFLDWLTESTQSC